MSDYRNLWWYAISVLGLFFILTTIGLFLTTPNWQNVTATPKGGVTTTLRSYDIGLDHAPTPGTATISGTLYLSRLSDKIIRILPDDCLLTLTINGQVVNLEAIDSKAKCAVDKGFSLNAERYLQNGANTITAEVENLGGGVKLDVQPAPEATNYKLFLAAVLCSLGLLLSTVAWRVLDSSHARAAFVLAISLCILYLGYTHWNERSHDVHGHIPYIEYVAANWSLPEPLECWECHQRPLYYVSAAGLLTLVNAYTGSHPQAFFRLLQLVALICFSIFLMFGLKVLTPHKSNWALYVFALWPSGILHSIRIGNEIPLYMALGLSAYFLDRYWRKPSWKLFGICLALALFASLLKITGAVALAVLGLLYLWKHRFALLEFKPAYLAGLATMGVLSAMLVLPTVLNPGSVSVNHPGDSMLVGNTLANFIYLDRNIFLNRPDISTFEDAGGRQYLLNILLKTAIFGEFSINEPLHRNVALALSFLLLCILALTLFGAMQLPKAAWRASAPVVLLTIMTFAALLYFRVTLPYSSDQDFRYMYPGLIGACGLLGLSLRHTTHFGWGWQQLGRALCAVWLLFSVAFILLPAITGLY
jgi:hypothetical protein